MNLLLISLLIATSSPKYKVAQQIANSAVIANIDATTTVLIANCESQFDPKAKNPDSSASGIFQFLKGTWSRYGKMYWGKYEFRNKSVLNPDDNIELAIWVIKHYGFRDWEASRKGCWGKV